MSVYIRTNGFIRGAWVLGDTCAVRQLFCMIQDLDSTKQRDSLRRSGRLHSIIPLDYFVD